MRLMSSDNAPPRSTPAVTAEGSGPAVQKSVAAKAKAKGDDPKSGKPQLVVRNATPQDIPGIQDLIRKVYSGVFTGPVAYSSAQLRGQQTQFPEGQFVAVYEDRIVGFAATFRVDESIALTEHDWSTITGSGYASRHDPEGNWIYGMEVCVDPDLRGLRIGQRLYNARKRLCEYLRLRGITFAGRMPGLARRWRNVGSAERYLELVTEGKQRDPVIGFQMRNGFESIRVLHNFLPNDRESLGYGVQMVWRNPLAENGEAPASSMNQRQQMVRVGAVQYQQRAIKSFEQFAEQVEYFVDAVANYKADFVVFPELFTLQLLSIDNAASNAAEAIAALSIYTERFIEMMSKLAVAYNINIIGGSHPSREDDGEVYNIAYVFLRDGSVHRQPKIHPTPSERSWWNIKGGDTLHAIETDCGPIGVLICYDSEFPELPRYLVDQGAMILFVPFCTDERQSYLRVRYCGQARAIENQCYVVLAGNVGNLPAVENMDIQYAQSCILTPCDFPFARDGIAADTTPNVEMVAIADLSIDSLRTARQQGTVLNLKDRRFDLYSVKWRAE
jgi:predicted amidohydrolase/GNAT superfamily N-acetyltransferase